MEINDLISPEGVLSNLRATGKKQALQELARKAASISGQIERDVFDILELQAWEMALLSHMVNLKKLIGFMEYLLA